MQIYEYSSEASTLKPTNFTLFLGPPCLINNQNIRGSVIISSIIIDSVRQFERNEISIL